MMQYSMYKALTNNRECNAQKKWCCLFKNAFFAQFLDRARISGGAQEMLHFLPEMLESLPRFDPFVSLYRVLLGFAPAETLQVRYIIKTE